MPAGTATDTKTTSPPVGVQQPQLARRLAGAGARELADAPALRLVGRGALLVGAGGDGLLERLQMRLHVVDARLLAQGRLHSLGHVVRLADRDVGGELEVQGDADLASCS